MSKQTEALKLALEALSPWAGEDANHTEQYAAYHAIREALAEQETVLPGGGHVPAVPVAVYGYCPECGGAGVMRERRPNGDDKCTNGHKYPSSKALAEQPAQHERVQPDSECKEDDGCPTEKAVLQRFWRKAQQQEPVAWRWENAGEDKWLNKYIYLDNGGPDCPEDCEPLYTSPPASKPLTDEQRNWVVATCPTPRHIIDTVEKMHGIKGDA